MTHYTCNDKQQEKKRLLTVHKHKKRSVYSVLLFKKNFVDLVRKFCPANTTHHLDHRAPVLGGKEFVTALQPLSEDFPAGNLGCVGRHCEDGSMGVGRETEMADERLPTSLDLVDNLD